MPYSSEHYIVYIQHKPVPAIYTVMHFPLDEKRAQAKKKCWWTLASILDFTSGGDQSAEVPEDIYMVYILCCASCTSALPLISEPLISGTIRDFVNKIAKSCIWVFFYSHTNVREFFFLAWFPSLGAQWFHCSSVAKKYMEQEWYMVIIGYISLRACSVAQGLAWNDMIDCKSSYIYDNVHQTEQVLNWIDLNRFDLR